MEWSRYWQQTMQSGSKGTFETIWSTTFDCITSRHHLINYKKCIIRRMKNWQLVSWVGGGDSLKHKGVSTFKHARRYTSQFKMPRSKNSCISNVTMDWNDHKPGFLLDWIFTWGTVIWTIHTELRSVTILIWTVWKTDLEREKLNRIVELWFCSCILATSTLLCLKDISICSR